MCAGMPMGAARTSVNAVSRVVKGATGASLGLALTAVDVTNNSLDVSLNTASASGPKSVSKLVDFEYFHGYGCHEHSLGPAAVVSASSTGTESAKLLAECTANLEFAEPLSVSAVASVSLTAAKSRTVVSN